MKGKNVKLYAAGSVFTPKKPFHYRFIVKHTDEEYSKDHVCDQPNGLVKAIGFALKKETKIFTKECHTCCRCGKLDKTGDDVSFVRDPYSYDVHADDVYGHWCNNCYSERVDEI